MEPLDLLIAFTADQRAKFYLHGCGWGFIQYWYPSSFFHHPDFWNPLLHRKTIILLFHSSQIQETVNGVLKNCVLRVFAKRSKTKLKTTQHYLKRSTYYLKKCDSVQSVWYQRETCNEWVKMLFLLLIRTKIEFKRNHEDIKNFRFWVLLQVLIIEVTLELQQISKSMEKSPQGM